MFSEKLEAILKRSGKSQYWLAEVTGLSKQAISQLVKGTKDPAWRTVQLCAMALEVSVLDFIDGSLRLLTKDEREARRAEKRAARQPRKVKPPDDLDPVK